MEKDDTPVRPEILAGDAGRDNVSGYSNGAAAPPAMIVSPDMEAAGECGRGLAAFDPVPVKTRHDGWSAQRQVAFIEALSQSGCVEEACRAVGMSQTSAYKLRGRCDARAFRIAWRVALDHGVERLADAAYSRALHGVPRPVFYRGEQVGEYRVFDEDLTKFILRYRDPVRFGKYKDAMVAVQHPEAHAVLLAKAVNLLEEELYTGEADFAAHGFAPSKGEYEDEDDE
ncbi:MAG: hypothetical protein HC843_07150 [Sphingomonadales bacterium]|nr:hypothetical protein [Sphingomonadales bacterium]